MSNWQRRNISDLLTEGDLVIGDGYRAKNEELSAHGFPFARAGNINNGFNFSGADCFPEAHIDRVGNKVSEPGDVVFTSKGTVGRFAFVRPETERFVYSPQLCFWRSRRHDRLHPTFLYYWMQGREFYVQFKGVSGQTDMAEYVSLTDQRRMKITLPPYGEQRAIASVLGALDDKIELNRRTNETLEATARAIFEDWFVDFGPTRAKMEARTPYLAAELWSHFPDRLDDQGKPEGWSAKPLDQVADFLNGLALQKYPASGSDFLPVIKISQLRAASVASADRASIEIPKQYIVENGDVLFSWSGSLIHRVWTAGRGALNQHLFKVTSKQFPKWFFFHWIAEHMPSFQATAASKATTMGHIQRHHLTQANVVIGTPAVIRAADELIAPLFNRQIANNLESRTLAATRDFLLPKLMSGEVRIKDAEKLAEPIK